MFALSIFYISGSQTGCIPWNIAKSAVEFDKTCKTVTLFVLKFLYHYIPFEYKDSELYLEEDRHYQFRYRFYGSCRIKFGNHCFKY